MKNSRMTGDLKRYDGQYNNNAVTRDFGITNDYISNEKVRRFPLLLARTYC